MSDEIKRGGKRTRKTPAPEGEKQAAEQPKANPYASMTPEEAQAKVSQLLMNIFFRSGTVPMAPDTHPKS
jgi:hypothetical protein